MYWTPLFLSSPLAEAISETRIVKDWMDGTIEVKEVLRCILAVDGQRQECICRAMWSNTQTNRTKPNSVNVSPANGARTIVDDKCEEYEMHMQREQFCYDLQAMRLHAHKKYSQDPFWQSFQSLA